MTRILYKIGNEMWYKDDLGCPHYIPIPITVKTNFCHNKEKDKNNMETRNVKLTLERAREWYKKGGELKEVALQVYSEEELKKVELPKSWGEFCNMKNIQFNEVFINGDSSISKVLCETQRNTLCDKNMLPSIKAAQAHLALMQLHQLRDYYRDGWKPEYTDYNYSIRVNNKTHRKSITRENYENSAFLSFQTLDLASEFLMNFEGLIMQANDLIQF